MKEKSHNQHYPYGDSCSTILVEIIAPQIANKIREKAEKKWQDHVNKKADELMERINSTPLLRENIDSLLKKHGVNEHDQRIYWSERVGDAIINIKFQDPGVMRQILTSSELKPNELAIYSGRLDDCGLPGSVSFFTQEIDEGVKVEMTYDNYLWGHGGYVLGSNENWEDFGYERVERSGIILKDLWKLK